MKQRRRAKEPPPTQAQLRALGSIEQHGDPWFRVHGMAEHGGFQGTLKVIMRRRWARCVRGKWSLTAAGELVLNGDRIELAE
jgi:hypothetical protein